MDNAPFYIGQKVIALATSPRSLQGKRVVKGTVYTVGWVRKCSCGKWIVALVELAVESFDIMCHMTDHGHNMAGGPADKFAPIQYTDITAELASQTTAEETSDMPARVKVESN